jgi:signal transduction histidine kinase
VVASITTFKYFETKFVEAEKTNQSKIARMVNHSLSLYFSKIQYILENMIADYDFLSEESKREEAQRDFKVKLQDPYNFFKERGIISYLSEQRVSNPISPDMPKEFYNWQIYKGIPENYEGKLSPRRQFVRNIYKAFPDANQIFQMDADGKLVFLEPYSTQVNLTNYQYDFRDYFKLAKKHLELGISEGYISHDKDRTQLISIPAPILKDGKFEGIFSIAISAKFFRDQFFNLLKQQLGAGSETNFYLIDRHGHIVASSGGENIYYPEAGKKSDLHDPGNIRNLGFFRDFPWLDDYLERGNVWERTTKSWDPDHIQENYFGVYENINKKKVFGNFYVTKLYGYENKNWGILVETSYDFLSLAENQLIKRFSIFGALLVGLLGLLFYFVFRYSQKLLGIILDKEKEIGRIASQAAHDIRSPLSALNVVSKLSGDLPEDQRLLIRSSVARIQDIANQLSDKKKLIVSDDKVNEEQKFSSILLSGLIDEIVTEKRMQYRPKINLEIAFRIDDESYGLFTTVETVAFKRMISNLIDNACESIIGKGLVEVEITSTKDTASELFIHIRDNGIGIAAEHLGKIGEKGFSFGKEAGTGLGVYHATQVLERIGGKLSYISIEGKGTTASIRLRKDAAPKWFIDKICLTKNLQVVVIDDDTSKKISLLGSGVKTFKNQAAAPLLKKIQI